MSTYTFRMLDDGKLPIGIKESLAKIFPSFAGVKIRLSISEAKEKRSLEQNSYYRGYVLPHVRSVRAENGDPVSLPKCHEDLLRDFSTYVTETSLLGKVYSRPKRTREMTTPEMANFITAITAHMSDWGNPIPLSEKQWEEQ